MGDGCRNIDLGQDKRDPAQEGALSRPGDIQL